MYELYMYEPYMYELKCTSHRLIGSRKMTPMGSNLNDETFCGLASKNIKK